MKIPLKNKNFAWYLCRRVILTKDNLINKNWHGSPQCVFCHHDETIKHLYNQVDIYKEQSNRDKEQINTLNRLLENQQILALESNKKIQKLENQLEEERQLNYSFDTSVNDRQNVNAQEATFTEESKDVNQEEDEQPTEVQHKDVAEEKKDDSTNEEVLAKDDKLSEEIESENEDRGEQPPKKGFWSRLFGN